MPAIAQDQAYHLFADQRSWLGIPRAADVLSNLAFVLVGLAGIARLASRRRTRFSAATEAGLWCVALGFLCTGAGSAWYHLNPVDATLAWDRLAMTLVFAGRAGHRDRAAHRAERGAGEPRGARPASASPASRTGALRATCRST